MKKIIICLAALLCTSLCNYAQEADDVSIKGTAVVNITKKDPKLIDVPKTKTVNQKSYKEKMAKDDAIRQNYKKDMGQDYFELYLILEKLLRANDFCYQNWRLAINKDMKNINASAGSVNLIIINSSLYDSLYQNKDALAFILAHELAHFILGHHQISAENSYKINNLKKQINAMEENRDAMDYRTTLNSYRGNYSSAVAGSISSLGYTAGIIATNNCINKIYKEERKLEVMADIEAVEIMTRAGFDIEKGLDALEFLSNMPNIYTNRSTHPPTNIRINIIQREMKIADIKELEKQGAKNIYNSDVLEVKKSSDKKSLVLSKIQNTKKTKYIPKTRENKLLEAAYRYYCLDEMDMAKEYFKDAFAANSANYIPALYLSYIYEREFLTGENKKSLKQARYWSKKANHLNRSDRNTNRQLNDIEKIVKEIKNNPAKNN